MAPVTIDYKELVENITDWIWEVDTTGHYTYASNKVSELLGYTPDEIIGKTPFELMPEAEAARVGALFADIVSRAAPFYQLVNTNLHKDGREIILETSGIPLFDASGALAGYRGIDRDITEQQQNRYALESLNRFVQAIYDSAQVIIVVLDPRGNILKINDFALQLTGYAGEEVMGRSWFTQFIPLQDQEQIKNVFSAVLENSQEYWHYENDISCRNGETKCISWKNSILYDENGDTDAILSVGLDITESKKHENELQLLANVYLHSSDAIAITDARQNILHVNQAFTEITGYKEDEVIGERPSLLKSGMHDKGFYQKMWKELNDTGSWKGEIRDRDKSGHIYVGSLTINAIKDKKGRLQNYISMFQDITARIDSEKKIRKLAYYDVLTDLPNRALFLDRLNQSLLYASRHRRQMGLFFIDIDNFKSINDTYGHHIGDLLLAEVTKRLQAQLRKSDLLARLGGDEFTLLIDDFDTVKDLGKIAHNVLRALEEEYTIDAYHCFVSASIGIAVYPSDGEEPSTLFKHADIAMYEAKKKGRNRYHFFKPELNRELQLRTQQEHALMKAIKQNEFVLANQPKVDLATGRVKGYEVLIRWNHPDSGLIAPDAFIPLAEESGKITMITQQVLAQACQQNRLLFERGYDLQVAVNISYKDIADVNFIPMLEQTIKESGIDPERLELEITENIMILRPEHALKTFKAIKKMGIRIALDDFGTGYSSLSYLKKFPIDTLKIDRSFIEGVPQDIDSTVLTQTIIVMAKNLKLAITAEGIEEPAQVDFLKEHLCDDAQGFHISKPLFFDDFLQWLEGYDGMVP